MTPRRLLPYLVLLAVLAAAYLGLQWRQERRDVQERQARKVFLLKEGQLGEMTLIRGRDEIRLVKQGQGWEITQPLKSPADRQTLDLMVKALAGLRKERDLGAVADLKPYGLDRPAFVLRFTADGRAHRLAVGGKAPGEVAYYALRDEEPQVLLIAAADKESLDRNLTALRDKTLLAARPEAIMGVKIHTDKTAVELVRTGPEAWRWVGRDDVKVRGDRVEALLRRLTLARVKDFAAEAPENLGKYGLAPKPRAEVELAQGDKPREILRLGAPAAGGVFARKDAAGVVVVDQELAAQIDRAAGSLEDRRLWTGPVAEVQKVAWGEPGQTWTAFREKEAWKLTGPGGRETKQPAILVEGALAKLSDLEAQRWLPPGAASSSQETFAVEAYGGDGKPRFRLAVLGNPGPQGVDVSARQGDQTTGAVLASKDFTAWQQEMARLTAPPATPD